MEEMVTLVEAFTYLLHELIYLLLILMVCCRGKKAYSCANKKMMKQILKSIK